MLKRLIFFVCFVVSVLSFNATANATFEDGVYTEDKKLFFYVQVKAGDLLEVDRVSQFSYSQSSLTISNNAGKALHTAQGAGKQTVKYTFKEDYAGFIVMQAGSEKNGNKIYEVRINGLMYFDGKNMINEIIDLRQDFASVDVTATTAKIVFQLEQIAGYDVEAIRLYDHNKKYIGDVSNPHVLKNLQSQTSYIYYVDLDLSDDSISTKLIISFTTKDYEKPNVQVTNITDVAATVNVNIPNKDEDVPENYEVYIDERLYRKTDNVEESVRVLNLKYETEYKVKVVVNYPDGKQTITEKTFKTQKYIDKIPPLPVGSLKAQQVGGEVLLTYILPPDADFSHVRIARDGVILADKVKTAQFTDPNVEAKNTYKYSLFSIDESGNASSAAVSTITIAGKEVTQLQASAKADKVELTWRNPTRTDYEKTKIYRKEKQNVLMRAFSMFSANDGYTPLFSANGNYFEDYTVESDTNYTYKVTNMVAGVETEGVTIDVKTPKVTVGGGSITPDPNPNDPDNPASYTVSWTSPTTGKLKAVVGGVEYKIVNAADLKIVIPAADMKFDKFGNYDVRLIPVDENGREIGVPANPGGGSTSWGGVNLGGLGLDPKSLLTVVAALLGLVGLIILLAMSFRVVPKLIDLLKTSFR